MKKSGLTDDIWEDIEAGNFSIPNLGAYFSCTHQVLGFQTKSGLLRTDNKLLQGKGSQSGDGT